MKSEGQAFDEKLFLGGWDLANFENLPWDCRVGGMVTLGIDWDIT